MGLPSNCDVRQELNTYWWPRFILLGALGSDEGDGGDETGLEVEREISSCPIEPLVNHILQTEIYNQTLEKPAPSDICADMDARRYVCHCLKWAMEDRYEGCILAVGYLI